MAFDPRVRLQRRLPGSRLRAEALPHLFLREEDPRGATRRELVPPRDQRDLLTLTFRKTRRVAEAGPNAPLLIRIVRHPYALHPGGRRRITWRQAAEPVQRVHAHAEVASALAERKRVRFNLDATARPQPFAVRPSTWKLLPPTPEEP